MSTAYYVLCRYASERAHRLVKSWSRRLPSFRDVVVLGADEIRARTNVWGLRFEPSSAFQFANGDNDDVEALLDQAAPAIADACGGAVVDENGDVLYLAWSEDALADALTEADRGAFEPLDHLLRSAGQDVRRAPEATIRIIDHAVASGDVRFWMRVRSPLAVARRDVFERLSDVQRRSVVEAARQFPTEPAIAEAAHWIERLTVEDEASRIPFPGKRGLAGWIHRWLSGDALAHEAISRWGRTPVGRRAIASKLVDKLLTEELPEAQSAKILHDLCGWLACRELCRLPDDPPKGVDAIKYRAAVHERDLWLGKWSLSSEARARETDWSDVLKPARKSRGSSRKPRRGTF